MKGMTIIAEIGTAHNGSLEKAYELIDAACQAGADMIKFQWVYADEILHPETGFVTLPGGKIRLYDRFKSLEVSPDFFAKCLERTHKDNMLFACSPFGLRSLNELVQIHPDAIKIASPEVNHIPLLKEIARQYGTIPIILSSGVSKLTGKKFHNSFMCMGMFNLLPLHFCTALHSILPRKRNTTYAV